MTPHEIIHAATNQALQTGDLMGTLGALSVALKTVEALYTHEVLRAQAANAEKQQS
jgi:hypothetical protein